MSYQQQGGYNNQQGGQQRQNSGFDNHVKIQVIGRLVKDPESKMVNNSKVATARIAINHRGQNADTDFWFIEVWGNEGADSMHNFLVNHCPKGRKVFIEGTPQLKQTQDEAGNYKYFPTIRIQSILGLDGGNNQQGGGQGGGQQQPPTGQYNQGGYGQPQQNQQQPPQQMPPQQGGYGQPPMPPQGQPNQAPPAQGGQAGFPPNPPGGYGAPAGAPNQGGFPPNPPQQ